MPCPQRKARLLLKQKKAKIVGLNDEVTCFGKRGWISGFTGTSSAYIIDGDGQYIQMPNKNYKQVTLNNVTRICHNNIWRYFVT